MRVRRRYAREPLAVGLAAPMMALRRPVELVLGRAVRRVSRRQPAVFARLGAFQSATFLILPTGWPVAFALSPRPRGGEVRVVRRDAPGPFAARIEGPLLNLLALFDGSLDADAAFFARSVQVEGDTSAVMALHNALEAADLTLADLLGLPVGGDLLNRGFEALRSAARRSTGSA